MSGLFVIEDNVAHQAVRAAAALTTSYVASDAFNIQGANQLQLLCSFTKGSSDGCRIKLEFSFDGTNYHQETKAEVNGTDVIHTAIVRRINDDGATPIIPIPMSARWCRISALAISDGTSSSLTINAILSRI